MINWENYFDKIYCLHYIPYTKRKQLMQFQLNRVGILNSGIFEWHYIYGTKLDEKFYQYVKEVKAKDNIYLFCSVTLGHYYCIRDAYYKGYKNILMIEDDVRFLKDLDKIEEILQNKPKDANVIMYDKFIFGYDRLKQFKPINQYYSTFSQCCSAGCYQLDRKGMERIIHLIETDLQTADGYFYNSKLYLNGLNLYCSTKNMAIQAAFKKACSIRIMGNQVRAFQMYYTYLGIKWNDYMIKKDGSEFKFGDYIEE